MFLVDSGDAAADWQGITGAIETVLKRSEAEVVSLRKWDERRLAYDINKKSRGTYILAYFNCDPLKIGSIERDVQLSEQIVRVMVLRTDRMTEEDMARPTPAMVVETEAAKRVAVAEERAAEKAAATAEAVETEPAAEEVEAPAAAEVAEDVVDVVAEEPPADEGAEVVAPAEKPPAEESSEEAEDKQ